MRGADVAVDLELAGHVGGHRVLLAARAIRSKVSPDIVNVDVGVAVAGSRSR